MESFSLASIISLRPCRDFLLNRSRSLLTTGTRGRFPEESFLMETNSSMSRDQLINEEIPLVCGAVRTVGSSAKTSLPFVDADH
ncbi:hypothetical protein CEXT_780111 [Caerostris extrusa]|uniref:Uncharacterized protein n=1 Tax=Caerostris extrusa TaxID=172846 RepID=A0AAV4X721_CAEEX|nr:hypothetical protein CEXT_780111 [Caerostris extrusa]